jgi:hypothetical protein
MTPNHQKLIEILKRIPADESALMGEGALILSYHRIRCRRAVFGFRTNRRE